MIYTRFIALGDSMTEGMCDEKINGNFRGWADRVADGMSHASADFTYVNLAVRGKLVGQVLTEQVPVALNYVQGKATLLSFHAGANDSIRPKYDAQLIIDTYNQAVDLLVLSGAQLMLFCVLENTGEKGKRAQIWNSRFKVFNENVRKKSKEVGAILLDPNRDHFWQDQRFLAPDRLHLNSEGHRRVSEGVLAALDLPHDLDWKKVLPPEKRKNFFSRFFIGIWWIIAYGLPWAMRRLRGRSSGDGRLPKYGKPIRWVN